MKVKTKSSGAQKFTRICLSEDDRLATSQLLRGAAGFKPSRCLPDLQHRIVHKRWGLEYQVCRSSEVELWMLEFSNRQATSLHCHPQTATCLAIVQGEVELSMLTRQLRLCAGDGVVVDAGVYHGLSAHANAVAVEAMYPPNRSDLLRLRDSRGRDLRSDGAHEYDNGASIHAMATNESRVLLPNAGNLTCRRHGCLWSVGTKDFHATFVEPECDRLMAFALETAEYPMISGEELLQDDSIPNEATFISVGFSQKPTIGERT